MSMTSRRVATPTARLAVLALLIGLAVVGLTTRSPRPPANLPSPSTAVSIGVVLAMTVPAAVLTLIAGLRHRRRRPTGRPAERRRPHQPRRLLAALLLLALLGITVAGSVLAAHL